MSDVSSRPNTPGLPSTHRIAGPKSFLNFE